MFSDKMKPDFCSIIAEILASALLDNFRCSGQTPTHELAIYAMNYCKKELIVISFHASVLLLTMNFVYNIVKSTRLSSRLSSVILTVL